MFHSEKSKTKFFLLTALPLLGYQQMQSSQQQAKHIQHPDAVKQHQHLWI
uniref:Translational activator GCN1 n=1 Tax=Rhizophora mucronata TaxID=61149 RepID=A0A2P2MM66_RHIMU